MDTLPLHYPTANDLEDLFAFETQNRAYFEANINARPATYYSLEGVAAAIVAAEQDAKNDTAYQFLVRNSANVLVARVNLTRVRRAHFHSAELGYRVAQSETGKGYASEAVRVILQKAFSELKLMRVEATAHAENVGSHRVLERNGFTQFGRSTNSFELNGVWHDSLLFERRCK
jgi:[ribosomal protein S5]-alanine N-acetyltransferase